MSKNTHHRSINGRMACIVLLFLKGPTPEKREAHESPSPSTTSGTDSTPRTASYGTPSCTKWEATRPSWRSRSGPKHLSASGLATSKRRSGSRLNRPRSSSGPDQCTSFSIPSTKVGLFLLTIQGFFLEKVTIQIMLHTLSIIEE